MAQSKLRQVLAAFEENTGPKSLSQIAHDLEITQPQLEGMIAYWVRRGKIREVADLSECPTCGRDDGCPFVLELPKSYELASDSELIALPMVGVATCQHKK
ncbi:MAG: FeoC-like transcriptional regulator [Chloroflexota bacterium]